MRGGSASLVISALVALVLVLLGGDASAHAVGLSRGDYVLAGSVVTAELTFARGEGATIDAADVLRGVVVSANGRACAGTVDGSSPVEPDGIAWRARFTCEDARGEVTLRLPLLDDLSHGHRHVAHLQAGGAAADDILYRGHAQVALDVGAGVAAEPPAAPARSCPSFAGMVRMGVEHILRGYDHLLFLFGLVLVGARTRALLKMVTAFTVAHSVTLGVAALGLWAPPSWLVEPAIALSIAYVGVENLFVSRAGADKRWRLTLPFGLIHGFGFAGALREIALPRADVPMALVSFNLGVELGQLAVLAPMLLLLWLLRRVPRFEGWGVPALSAATAAVGALWFVLRIVHPGV
jgi:hydrogenase/urease accessory protein HupE